MPGKRIALTGGIATGKTTVANRLKELGAVILDADEFARRAVRPGSGGWRALREWLGAEFFDPDGALRRRKLREKIVGDPDARKKLDQILHPFILGAMEEEWESNRVRNPRATVIFDIPLLFEGGFDKSFDIIVLVYAPPEVQVERLTSRDDLTREQAQKTLAIQLPIESKKAKSDYIIDNSGDLDHTLRQTLEVWEAISR